MLLPLLTSYYFAFYWKLGLNQYSDDPEVEFPLNQYFTQQSLFEAIDDVAYMKGNTYIGKAMNFTREFSLVESAGARPYVKKVKGFPPFKADNRVVRAAQMAEWSDRPPLQL